MKEPVVSLLTHLPPSSSTSIVFNSKVGNEPNEEEIRDLAELKTPNSLKTSDDPNTS